MNKMKKKKSSTSSIYNPFDIVGPWLSQLRSSMLLLLENSTGRCRGRKGRWPSSHTLRLDEISLQQDFGEEGRESLVLHMLFILSMTVPLGQRWRLDKQQDGVIKSVPKGQMLWQPTVDL